MLAPHPFQFGSSNGFANEGAAWAVHTLFANDAAVAVPRVRASSSICAAVSSAPCERILPVVSAVLLVGVGFWLCKQAVAMALR